MEEVVLGMLGNCTELVTWVKNTSFQWHKAQSFVLSGVVMTGKIVRATLELYVTPATQSLKIRGSSWDMSIKACTLSSRLFLELPSIIKLLNGGEENQKYLEKVKRMILNEKLLDFVLI